MQGEFEIEIGDGKRVSVEWEVEVEDTSFSYAYGGETRTEKSLHWDVRFSYFKDELDAYDVEEVESALADVDVARLVSDD